MNQAAALVSQRPLEELTTIAVLTLRLYVPPDGQPYYGCFSGGKDSTVLKHLVAMAGVPVEWWHNLTTIDPPETIHYIKQHHPDVRFSRPQQNFFTRALVRGFPTRRQRWCCAEYKESSPPIGRRILLGVRAEESPRRAANWRHFTWHRSIEEYAVCPILAWPAKHVWKFIRRHKLAYNPLYDEGFTRTGCIGCPMGRQKTRLQQFARWPGYGRKWRQLFQAIWEKRSGTTQRDGRPWFGDRHFQSWGDMWNWWLSDEPLPDELPECHGLNDLFSN